MIENITFHKMGIYDVDEYLKSEQGEASNRLYSPVLKRKEAKEEITTNEIYCIQMNGVVVGKTEYTMISSDEAYLGGLVIDKNYRGKGIGRKATEFRLNKIGKVSRTWLTAHPENFTIIQLYESLGFTIESRGENYYGDGEPRIIMSLLRN